jgi:hypothetical protein
MINKKIFIGYHCRITKYMQLCDYEVIRKLFSSANKFLIKLGAWSPTPIWGMTSLADQILDNNHAILKHWAPGISRKVRYNKYKKEHR